MNISPILSLSNSNSIPGTATTENFSALPSSQLAKLSLALPTPISMTSSSSNILSTSSSSSSSSSLQTLSLTILANSFPTPSVFFSTSASHNLIPPFPDETLLTQKIKENQIVNLADGNQNNNFAFPLVRNYRYDPEVVASNPVFYSIKKYCDEKTLARLACINMVWLRFSLRSRSVFIHINAIEFIENQRIQNNHHLDAQIRIQKNRLSSVTQLTSISYKKIYEKLEIKLNEIFIATNHLNVTSKTSGEKKWFFLKNCNILFLKFLKIAVKCLEAVSANRLFQSQLPYDILNKICDNRTIYNIFRNKIFSKMFIFQNITCSQKTFFSLLNALKKCDSEYLQINVSNLTIINQKLNDYYLDLILKTMPIKLQIEQLILCENNITSNSLSLLLEFCSTHKVKCLSLSRNWNLLSDKIDKNCNQKMIEFITETKLNFLRIDCCGQTRQSDFEKAAKSRKVALKVFANWR